MKMALYVIILCLVSVPLFCTDSPAQDIFMHHGDTIPSRIENMYTKGLAYLVKTQSTQGTWPGQYGTESGVVGLGVLAMLAHGEDPNTGPYSTAIKRSLDYLLKIAQPSNGYMGSSMYNHGFATLALAEAYGVVDNPKLGPALKKSVELLLTCQENNGFGAWRYSPTSRDADATVSGAQMVALFAARNAGIGVPEKAIRRGLRFFRQCQGGGGGIGYQRAGSPTPACTAIGALVFALAKEKDGQEFKSAYKYLEQMGQRGGSYPYYYLYYASQAFFHADMRDWESWNSKNVATLASTQNSDGSWRGSHGEVFSTSASLLSLALNYRLLPIYER
ncbi:MAG: terpene cyclase/mutase family protein [Kiritimatiellia bacterium]|jgi:hypothetical protein|nr:terpene cyclase/mutase family protein [Kiritimatiellia bacterium]MDP6848634.1 terpene cyclase/mutase family protein [Kiritimatiellia bacterium]